MADKKAAIEQSITATKGLRSSVSNLFENLVAKSAGVKEAGSTEAAKSSEFVENLKKNLVNVQKSLGSIEKAAQQVNQARSDSSLVALGNTGLLSLDPVEDKTPLYGQLLESYNWHEKLKIQSQQAVSSLKRQHPCSVKISEEGLVSKKARAVTPPLASKPILDALKAKHPSLKFQSYRIYGSSVWEVTVPKAFRANIILRAGSIDEVMIRGLHESTLISRQADVWVPSQHAVFQKLTEYANSATLHYFSLTDPYSQILGLMRWLDTSQGLFSKKCTKCELHLKDDEQNTPLPPCWKAYDTFLPYHYSCRP